MRPLVYLTHASELPHWRRAGVTEVIVALKEFSRRGTLSWEEARALAGAAHGAGMRTTFEWDALMEEPRFRALSHSLSAQPFPFSAIRVRDAGAIRWARENLTCPLQLLLEAGHHNQLAIRSWQARLGARLERVALSPELPWQVIRRWREELGVHCEILALGPLLLFHSPRPLLSSLSEAGDGEELWAEGASEESPHKGFPLQENAHGTLMFHPKDLSLLERWDDLPASLVDVVRLDHRQQGPGAVTLLADFLQTGTAQAREALKSRWRREWMRGYWDVNKSDVLFPKLKNPHLAYDQRVRAEVLEGKREGWLAVRACAEGLELGQEVVLVNPHGEQRPLAVKWLKDDGFVAVERLSAGQVGFIPWCVGMPSKSRVLAR